MLRHGATILPAVCSNQLINKYNMTQAITLNSAWITHIICELRRSTARCLVSQMALGDYADDKSQ